MDMFGNNPADSSAATVLAQADPQKSQSFLLEGPDGIGKHELALKFACDLLDNQERVRNNSHPDFLLVERKYDDKKDVRKKEIVVDDARKVGEFLSLTPAEGMYRVVVINSADCMNIAAANSILKVVEEPPKRSVIILLSHGGRVLPTIRSRCISIKIPALDSLAMDIELTDMFPDISSADRKIISFLSEGSPGLAKRIYETDGLKIAREVVDIFAGFPKFDYIKTTTFLEKLAKNADAWAIFKLILAEISVSVAKKTALREILEIEGKDLNSKLSKFQALLDADAQMKKDLVECEIYNLDKKQVMLDNLIRFARCYS